MLQCPRQSSDYPGKQENYKTEKEKVTDVFGYGTGALITNISKLLKKHLQSRGEEGVLRATIV